MYVYKEVWMHPASRWLWLMEDFLGPPMTPSAVAQFDVSATMVSADRVTIRLVLKDSGKHTFTLRAENLMVDRPTRTVTGRAGRPVTLEWKARRTVRDAAWVAVVIPDGDVSRRREVLDSASPR
jgi:hypothetical protein